MEKFAMDDQTKKALSAFLTGLYDCLRMKRGPGELCALAKADGRDDRRIRSCIPSRPPLQAAQGMELVRGSGF